VWVFREIVAHDVEHDLIHEVNENSGPDEEFLPFPPRALRALGPELDNKKPEIILSSEPWGRWWRASLWSVVAFVPLAVLSGMVTLAASELATSWQVRLAVVTREVLATSAGMIFVVGMGVPLYFLPTQLHYRQLGELMLHSFNALWLGIRAGTGMVAETGDLRLAGLLVMMLALHQVHQALLAGFALASFFCSIAVEHEQPPFLISPDAHGPIKRLSELLMARRSNAEEVHRELLRDVELRPWYQRHCAWYALGVVLCFAAGLSRDVVLIMDALGDVTTSFSKDQLGVLHHWLILPVCDVVTVLGAATLFHSAVGFPLEAFLRVKGYRGANEQAVVIVAWFNALFTSACGVGHVHSSYTSRRIAGLVLLLLSTLMAYPSLMASILWYRAKRQVREQPAAGDPPDPLADAVGSSGDGSGSPDVAAGDLPDPPAYATGSSGDGAGSPDVVAGDPPDPPTDAIGSSGDGAGSPDVAGTAAPKALARRLALVSDQGDPTEEEGNLALLFVAFECVWFFILGCILQGKWNIDERLGGAAIGLAWMVCTLVNGMALGCLMATSGSTG
jgi:hypothetical protein